MNDSEIIVRLLDPLPATLWAIAGAIATHLWRRYLDRMVTLRWQASHQSLAVSGQDALFGTIEVKYNGNPVNNLFFSTIDIQNDSNRDITDLDLNFIFQDGTAIFMSHGAVLGSANSLPFADPFKRDLDAFMAMQSQDKNAAVYAASLRQRRDYRVPVLNRRTSLRVAMLVQAPPGRQPQVLVATDHQGLRLLFQAPRNLLLGVDRHLAALVGLLVGIGIVAAICITNLDSVSMALLSFVVGCFAAALGAVAVRAVRWLSRAVT